MALEFSSLTSAFVKLIALSNINSLVVIFRISKRLTS